MAASDLPPPRSLGGLDALSAYRAERAATRLRLRESLRASRTALRASRAMAPAEERREPVVAASPAEEPSIFAELLGRHGGEQSSAADLAGITEITGILVPAAEDLVTAGAVISAPPVAAEAEPVASLDAPDPPAATPPPVTTPRAGEAGGDLGAIAELGPGMRLRLAQLGVHTLDDLARVDPAALRLGLGAISRMLRVERWIEAARSLQGG